MKAESKLVEFTPATVDFLWEKGYTHIFSRGAANTNNGPDGGEDDYYLLPIRPGDLRHQFEEAEFIISSIDSQEVKDMAYGVDFIRFLIELPIEEYQEYQKLR